MEAEVAAPPDPAVPAEVVARVEPIVRAEAGVQAEITVITRFESSGPVDFRALWVVREQGIAEIIRFGHERVMGGAFC
ncbi:hypothetical protein ACQP2X_13020 [Actinoplanes sp. CA-131856]